MNQLLDPTNDYVFKRLLSEAPDLLVALINDLRAYSGARLPLIPRQACHPFQGKAATDSTARLP
ncbi:hypothetical protein SAMN05444515_1373, partial [Ectothiorhodospira marina]